MAYIVYPLGLPMPSISTVQSDERRRIPELEGVRNTSILQMDRLELQELEFVFDDFDKSEEFRAWHRDDLVFGACFFSAKWPLPRGMVSAVRRFIEMPKWQYLPAAGWRVTAMCEVRGIGLPPVIGDALITKRYQVIFPTGVSGIYTSTAAAIAAARDANKVVGLYPDPYRPGSKYVSFKTSANPVLNCFSGGAVLADAHDYVDYYFSAVEPTAISDYSGGGTNFCTYLAGAGAAVDGSTYLNREADPVITSNDVDTTAWGPFKIVSTTPGAVAPLTPSFPMFQNNCTNYPIGANGFPQVIMCPFTIIRGLDD
jgi:hypothetical protein